MFFTVFQTFYTWMGNLRSVFGGFNSFVYLSCLYFSHDVWASRSILFFSKTKSGFLSFFGLGECQIHGQIWFSNTTFVSRHWWARISWFLHITNKPGVHKYIVWKVMDLTTQWGKFKFLYYTKNLKEFSKALHGNFLSKFSRISGFLPITNKPGVHKYILWKVMDVTTQWGKFKVIQIIWKIFQKLSMAIFCRKLTFEKSTFMTHQIKKVL